MMRATVSSGLRAEVFFRVLGFRACYGSKVFGFRNLNPNLKPLSSKTLEP